MSGPQRTDPAVRFDAKVDKTGPVPLGLDTPCWLWMGGTKPSGYGVFGTGGRTEKKTNNAHRWNYERHSGPIPAGMTLDHLCRVRNCVNPGHMEIVTQAENNARGNSATARNARKTHCPAGHPLLGDNLSAYHLKIGQRMCRTCYNARQARRRARLKSN